MNDGGRDESWCLSFIGFVRPDLSPWGYRNMCFLVALCHLIVRRLNLWYSVDSGNFSVRGYLPLIQKDSNTHMHGLANYVKEELPFPRDVSLENSCGFLHMFSSDFTSVSVLLLFPLAITFFVFVHRFLFYFM